MRLNLDNISIEEKACLNHLAKEQICSSCVDSCPINVIYIEQQVPVVNQSSCINCGLCISSCQTLALDHTQKSYPLVSKQIKEYPDSIITCSEMESYQKGIKVPCYLYLDVPLILQYGDGKEVIKLYTGKCSTCPKAETFSVEKHIEKIQHELNQLQIKFVIHLEQANIDNAEDQVINGLTRRDLFKRFSIKNVREAILNKEEESKGEETKNLSIIERTKFKRELLNDYLVKNQFSNDEYLPLNQFANIGILESCNGCNVCEQVCPTNAITWHTSGSNSELVFNLKDCIACQKCLICPEKAIKIEPITINQFRLENSTTLQKFTLKKCQDCGEEYRTKLPTNICMVCEANSNKDPKRFFAHYFS